ncbi:hypothetical protein TSH7_09900 [Azospirillum sp. TSH7]|uniref:hypothetical protein n=1 Tax=unclassified Azospirillum TaxID=2630922 RepID=UPI000D61F917|nr:MULTISPECIES: hypothetical protein [unclassified Azospirillum]PWC63982.1 hypothetical protein TSH20_18995 [Azospirillum sp. TSH20]PWC64845.1 hypothetical protein TSH7_09900 [Azospirillum sp. TSH7]
MIWPMVIAAGVSLASGAMSASAANRANAQAGAAAARQYQLGQRQQEFAEKRYRDEMQAKLAENAFMSDLRDKQIATNKDLFAKGMDDYLTQRGWAVQDRDMSQQLAEEVRGYQRDVYQDQQQNQDLFYDERGADRALRNAGYAQDRGYLGSVYASEQARINQDMELRANLLDMATRYGGTIDEVMAALGQMEDIPDFLSSLQGETASRTAAYQADVDRALERAGSTGAADMIRKGLDRSTLEVERERDLAATGAKAYQDARMRAAQEALALITGQQQSYLANRGARVDDRGRVVREATAGQGASMEAMLKMMGDRKPTIAPKAQIEPESMRYVPTVSAPNLSMAQSPRLPGLPTNPYLGIARLDTSMPSLDFSGDQASSRSLGYYGDYASNMTKRADAAVGYAGGRFDALMKELGPSMDKWFGSLSDSGGMTNQYAAGSPYTDTWMMSGNSQSMLGS